MSGYEITHFIHSLRDAPVGLVAVICSALVLGAAIFAYYQIKKQY
jgi:hypothetical protein